MMKLFFNHRLSRTTLTNVRVGRARTPAAPHIATPGRARSPSAPHWIVAVCTFFALALTSFAADPAITVSARQRYPWNGLVDVNFTITGDAGTKYDTSFTAKDMVGNTNITMQTIRKADGSAANVVKEQLTPGNYKWVWDAAADLPKDFQCDRVTVTGTANEFKPLYMVIDLSGGANASSYPVSYLDAVPSGGWSDTYKTTKLVLRRIESGSFKMGGSYNVTLTKPFYMGVFEVTQKQYKQVTGTNPVTSGESGIYGDMLPVTKVDYSMIRGSTKGAKWPQSADVDDSSFLGKLQSRSGHKFDLPTEAQWEYACRAGTTSSYNNGGNSESDLKLVGRYIGNNHEGNRSVPSVPGKYKANSWGLYDMHGNFDESVLDWGGDLVGNVTDPKGPTTGRDRVKRGVSYYSYPKYCTSSSRRYSSGWSAGEGFRICLTLSN